MNENRAPFRVKCIKSCAREFSVGEIYEVNNKGQILNQNGVPLTSREHPAHSFEGWHGTLWGGGYVIFEEVPVLPNICRILGDKDNPLEINEEFKLEGGKDTYRINANGGIEYKSFGGWCVVISSCMLEKALNHPEKIIRKPKLEFTENQKGLMKMCVDNGYPWAARDKSGGLCIYKSKPSYSYDGKYYYASEGGLEELPEIFLPQFTYENSPIDMRDYMGDKNDC